MKPEEVALRYADSRPGMELVNFFEVGLPFWKLKLAVTMLARRSIPPIEEFVLKSIDAGLVFAGDIGDFLGLDERLSVATLSDMLYEGFIRTIGPGQYALTDLGRVTLKECEVTSAEQEQINVFYDGLTHETLFLSDTDFTAPSELKKRGIREWGAWPADPPGVEKVDLLGIRAAWEAKDYHRKRKKEIISIDSIAGKRQLLYLEAVALVFESSDPSERPQVAFAIDHRLSDAHEAAFAAASGERKHNLLASLRRSSDAEVRTVVGAARLADARRPEVVEAVKQVEKVRAELQAAERKTRAVVDGPKTQGLLDEVERLRVQLAEAEARQSTYTARPVPVYEHPQLLRAAFHDATERVLVISPWIRAAVVDMDFLNMVKETLQRGVQVAIGYGIGGRDGDGDYMAIRALEGLGSYGNLQMTRLGNTHAKILIKDHDWYVTTSFNWLSFRGDPNKPLRDERGTYCSDRLELDNLYAEYIKLIQS